MKLVRKFKICVIFGNVAQLVEQRTLNPSVQGSNPCVPTNFKKPAEMAGFLFFCLRRRQVIPQHCAEFCRAEASAPLLQSVDCIKSAFPGSTSLKNERASAAILF